MEKKILNLKGVHQKIGSSNFEKSFKKIPLPIF